MMSEKHGIAYLEISTWAGVAFDARHYYGRLVYENNAGRASEEVSFKLNEGMAGYMNMLDRHSTYRAGDDCTRFIAPQEVVEAGIALFKSKFQAGVLLEGSPVYAEPHKVLCVVGLPDELMTEGNALFEQNEACHSAGGWDKHEADMNRLCDQWSALIASTEAGIAALGNSGIAAKE